jgi:hypothetical protein
MDNSLQQPLYAAQPTPLNGMQPQQMMPMQAMQPMMQMQGQPSWPYSMPQQGANVRQMQPGMQPGNPQMQQQQMPYGVNYPSLGVSGAQAAAARQSSEDAAMGTRGQGQVTLA